MHQLLPNSEQRNNNTHKSIEFNNKGPIWQPQHQSKGPTTASNTNTKVGCRSNVGSWCVVMAKSDRRMFCLVATWSFAANGAPIFYQESCNLSCLTCRCTSTCLFSQQQPCNGALRTAVSIHNTSITSWWTLLSVHFVQRSVSILAQNSVFFGVVIIECL
jgi:hypothetical protein